MTVISANIKLKSAANTTINRSNVWEPLMFLFAVITLCSSQRCVSLHQPPSPGRGSAKMLPVRDDKSDIMDSSQASVCNVCQAALVGRVIQWDTFLSEGCITAVPEDHKNHSSLPHPLWAKAVHIVSYR